MDKVNDNQTLEMLTQVIAIFARIIRCVTDQSDHFNEIKKLINLIYPTKNWSILRLDETTNQLFFTVIESDIELPLKQIPIKVGDGICGLAASTGKTQIMSAKDKKLAFTQSVDEATHFVTHSIIALPIKHYNKVVGVLELINLPNQQAYIESPLQMVLLNTIADLIGVIFLFSSTHQEIMFSSERDTLTGVFNRHYLNKILSRNRVGYSGDSTHFENELLLVMVDLNNFKKVNDEYGHLVGDNLLRETARLLGSHFRPQDLIIRYGGDEFLLVLKPAHHNQFEQLVNIVNEKLNYISSVLEYSCTLAYGMAQGNQKDFLQLFAQADKNMYINKRHGKDGR